MKTFDLRPTSDPNLFRVVDRNGEWEHYWHQPADRYLRGVTAILHRAWGKPELFKWAKHQLPGIVEQKLHYGGEKGDAVHQFNAKILAGENCDMRTQILSEDHETGRELTHPEWDCVLSFDRFMTDHRWSVVAFEMAVANLLHGYAGSFDAIFRLLQACKWDQCACKPYVGKLLLLDWKSGGGIYDDMGAQVAAYANADLRHILRGHRLAGTAIVRLGTRHKRTGGYETQFYNWHETRRHFTEFKAAIRIDNASYKPFDPKSIIDIPESLTLRVEREELEPRSEVAA